MSRWLQFRDKIGGHRLELGILVKEQLEYIAVATIYRLQEEE
jgi:hypothetical protein